MYLGNWQRAFYDHSYFLFDINNLKNPFLPHVSTGMSLNDYLLCHTMETAAALVMTEQNKKLLSRHF